VTTNSKNLTEAHSKEERNHRFDERHVLFQPRMSKKKTNKFLLSLIGNGSPKGLPSIEVIKKYRPLKRYMTLD